MSSADVAVVNGMFESLAAGDIDRMATHFQDDIAVLEAENLPYGGVHKGVRAFREDLLAAIAADTDLVVEGREMLDTGVGLVVCRMYGTFTSKHTGRTVRMPMVEIYRIVDGKIAEIDVYYKDVTEMSKLFAER